MGIMHFSRTVLKNLGGKPATRLYPRQKREPFERTRGHIAINESDCIFCGICQKKCPTKAIGVDKPSKTWRIDRFKCIQCNACTENCPKKCLSMKNEYTSPSTGQVKDEYHA